MGGEYIPMTLSLQWIISFEKTSETSSEIAAEFGFFVSINNENDDKSRKILTEGWICYCFYHVYYVEDANYVM